jgi:quinol monooxygenase YgiN
MNMGQFVIVAYRPKTGKETELLELIKNHVPTLQGEGLATERTPYVMRAADGTIVEIFEWQSAEAIERAHTNKVVLEMWEKFSAACETDMIANLEESKRMFSPFAPIDF